jgi:hypothetical protein
MQPTSCFVDTGTAASPWTTSLKRRSSPSARSIITSAARINCLPMCSNFSIIWPCKPSAPSGTASPDRPRQSSRRCSEILPFGRTGHDGPGPGSRGSSLNSRLIARRHKAQLEKFFAELLARSGAERPNELARAVWLLSEGAISLMLVHGDRGYSAAASEAAITLVRHHLKEGARALPPQSR